MRHGAAPRCPRHPLLPAQLWLCPNAVASASVEGPGRDLAAPDSEQAGRKVRAHAADAGAFQRLSQACVHSRRCVWHRGDTRPASATMAATTRRWSTTRSWDTQLPRSTTERSRLVRCKVGGSCSTPGSPHCSIFSACRPAAAHAQHAAQPTASHAAAAGGAEVPDHQGFSTHSECVTSLPQYWFMLTCAGAQRSKHKHRKARSPVCSARGGVFGRHQRCAGACVIIMRGGRPFLTCRCASRCCW